MDISEWIWAVVASSAGTVTLLGIAAFMARHQLTHWLSKDLARVQAQYQRELEAYKVSLIAQTEGIKAAQDVKKASALRVLEKKFAAVDSYHRASVGLDTKFASHVAMPNNRTTERYFQLSANVDDLREAENILGLFCTDPQRQALLDFRSMLIAHMGLCLPNAAMPRADEMAALNTDRMQRTHAANEVIKALTAEMLALQ